MALGIESLQQLATDRFKECIKNEGMPEKFVTCVKLTFESTKNRKRVLRKEVMAIVGKHSKTLWQLDGFQQLVASGGDFTLDFAARLIESL